MAIVDLAEIAVLCMLRLLSAKVRVTLRLIRDEQGEYATTFALLRARELFHSILLEKDDIDHLRINVAFLDPVSRYILAFTAWANRDQCQLDEPHQFEELIRKLLEICNSLLSGQKISQANIGLLRSFFDALFRQTGLELDLRTEPNQ